MKYLENDDIELIKEMHEEAEKLAEEVDDELKNETLGWEVGSLFDSPEAMAIVLMLIHATLDPTAKGRLERVATAYKDGTI